MITLLLFLGYSAGHRADGAAWTVPLMMILLLNLKITYSKAELYSGICVDDSEGVPDKQLSLNSSPTPPLRAWMKALRIVNIFVKALAVLFLVLLLGGAWTLGSGYHKYAPRGKFVTLTYADGKEQKLHYLCEGPLTERPTIWFEVGGGHTMCDFYGLQLELAANNYRSCIYDRPGLGWSEYSFPDQPYWYYDLLKATGEPGPFVLAVWAAGGEITYPFVTEHPDMVYSWVLMDVGLPTEDWNINQYLYNWTDAETEAFKKKDLDGRYVLFDVIRALGTPFGWMNLFLPSTDKATYIPQDRYDEFRWHQLLEKHVCRV